MARERKKILYFIRGAHPTSANQKRADSFGADANVCFRNVNKYRKGEDLEHCDGVIGYPPEEYVKAYGKVSASTVVKQSDQSVGGENEPQQNPGDQSPQPGDAPSNTPVDNPESKVNPEPAPTPEPATKATKSTTTKKAD